MRTIIVLFGIWCERRSLFHFRRSVIGNNKGRSVSVESSYCLVFGVKGHSLRDSYARAYSFQQALRKRDRTRGLIWRVNNLNYIHKSQLLLWKITSLSYWYMM
ncbi:hypothetical protein [Tychonema sp. BBK16]|uniref:hypothetical protein n=1 Tax=Tychonema sp. BBK16 TaxID=2699888 RepID=UPI001F242D16|nr:hypothetical protein [Tychonema sp. BBK16]MCF6374361.1 hypothetical protein [Tychonema sp. BBK16]